MLDMDKCAGMHDRADCLQREKAPQVPSMRRCVTAGRVTQNENGHNVCSGIEGELWSWWVGCFLAGIS